MSYSYLVLYLKINASEYKLGKKNTRIDVKLGGLFS